MTGDEAVVHDALVADDAMDCARLEGLLFPGDDPWSARTMLSEIGSRHTRCLAARVPRTHPDTEATPETQTEPRQDDADAASRLVGYAVLAELGPADDPEFEVHTIGVDPDFQGRGIGRALLRRMLEIADGRRAPVLLDVRTDNVPALQLYEAHGFVVQGVRRRYYRPSGADAYVMARPAAGGEDGPT